MRDVDGNAEREPWEKKPSDSQRKIHQQNVSKGRLGDPRPQKPKMMKYISIFKRILLIIKN